MSPSVWRRFFAALGRSLYVSGRCCRQLVMEVALGLLIGFVEGWSVGEAIYFSFGRGRRSRTSKSACPMGRLCCEV
jgi:hypothetical protein